MDEAVTDGLGAHAANAIKAAALALLFAAGAQARGQALQDPTRPPAAAAPGGGERASVASGPRLQSILIAREAGGRHVAVIEGETVRLGEQFRGARVVRIGDNEVELVRGRERQVLRLYALEAASLTPLQPRARAQANPNAQARR